MINHKYTTEQDALIIELWNSGKSGSIIGEELNLSRCAVLGKLHRLRIAGHAVEKRVSEVVKEKRFKAVEENRKQLPLFPYFLQRLRRLPKIVLYQIEKEESQTHKYVTLMELKPSMCRYVMDNSDFGNALYCGDPMEKGSYCKDHAMLCYLPKDKEGQRLRKEALNYNLVKLSGIR